MKPIGKRVLVELTPKETVLSSGIILPDMTQERSDQGIVVAVGNITQDIKEGDKVQFHKKVGVEIKNKEGKDCLILTEDDVYLKL